MNTIRLLFVIVLSVAMGFARAQERETVGVQGAQVVPEQALRAQKNYYAYGALDISGLATWTINSYTNTASFTVERLDNNAASGVSYPIRIILFVTAAPISDAGFTYWPLTHQDQPGLAYNFYRTNIQQSGPLEFTPPNGIYYLHIGVFEQEPTCNATNTTYCMDDYFTFDTQLLMTDGVWSIYTPAAATATAIEYFYGQLGHYFSTAQQDEINALDTGYFPGWTRTGQTFKLWTSGAAYADVCRFFTSIYATHFYTALAAECAQVKLNPVWTYEKIAGKVQFPTGGVCPAGTQYLYRLFNNGIGGYPNHRYTVSLTIRAQMIAAGWSPEDDNTVCVPL